MKFNQSIHVERGSVVTVSNFSLLLDLVLTFNVLQNDCQQKIVSCVQFTLCALHDGWCLVFVVLST